MPLQPDVVAHFALHSSAVVVLAPSFMLWPPLSKSSTGPVHDVGAGELPAHCLSGLLAHDSKPASHCWHDPQSALSPSAGTGHQQQNGCEVSISLQGTALVLFDRIPERSCATTT